MRQLAYWIACIWVMLGVCPLFAQTVCLNMIVKNESKAIKRCLDSVKGHIDYWVIVDTGSTDGTQAIIKNELANIPGELHERPWVDFAHNRNEALELAKGKADYILLVDADEELVFTKPLKQTKLEADLYTCVIREPSSSYLRDFLIATRCDWKWKGVLHEYLENPKPYTSATIETVTNISRTQDGARSQDPLKYQHDAEILEKALKKEPDNSRYVFYLGQCYFNARNYPEALKAYEKRIPMHGDIEEAKFSSLMVAILRDELGYDYSTIVSSYYFAHRAYPERVESLILLAKYYLRQNQPLLAYLVSREVLSSPKPIGLHVIDSLYVYERWLVFASSALAVGKTEEAYKAFEHLLSVEGLKPEQRKLIEEQLFKLKKN